MSSTLEEIKNSLGIEAISDGISYHYTNTDALLSILENKTLWISEVNFLNDLSEVQHIFDIIKNSFDYRKWSRMVRNALNKRIDPNQELISIEQFFEESLFEALNNFFSVFDIFVLSMSVEADSLAVWSNYSKGEGYNIGFHLSEFLSVINKSKIESSHGKVIYNREQQEEILQEVIDEYMDFTPEINNPELETEKKSDRENLIMKIVLCSIFFKKYCFKPENEYRFVFMQNKLIPGKLPIKFRTINNSIIPYIEIPISETKESSIPLSTITIGPKNNSDIAKTGLTYFLKHHHYGNVNEIIKKSEIPLRY